MDNTIEAIERTSMNDIIKVGQVIARQGQHFEITEVIKTINHGTHIWWRLKGRYIK